MIVLLTGATGFIGSHVTRALLAAGHDVPNVAQAPGRQGPALQPVAHR